MRGPAGFTLVELMVSAVLLGVVSGIIWALFSSTSGALREADSLADTLDRARFALEQVSADVRSAGAFGSPDSQEDPWTLPRPTGTRRVVGLASYDGWQDDTSLYTNAVQAAHFDDNGLPAIGFDGFVVIGALDFSTTFEVRGLSFQGGGGGSGSVAGFAIGGRIPLTAEAASSRFAERGLKKLMINDPFYTETGLFGQAPNTIDETHPMVKPVWEGFENRLVRVMDRQGYLQFGAVDGAPTWQSGVEFGIAQPGLQTKISSQPFGLQPQSAGDADVGYETALLDAYWYHVEADPEDVNNFQLVRDRLNADAVTQALDTDWSSISSADLLAMAPAARERTVLSDRVVDFQFWVDCADGAGNLDAVAWQDNWVPPAGSSVDNHDCLDPSDPEPGRARVAHIRLSVRTENERVELGHQGFLNASGQYDSTVPLSTFDVDPDSQGATRVVVVQSDVELTNFAYKNITR